MATNSKPVFLKAEWRFLAMLNYEIEATVLAPFIPAGTELDSWNGKTFISVVGFLFLDTRFWGIPIPFHRNFEEVNLRFYVRRKADDGWRRGVVFIKELVPRRVIALVARAFYNEKYVAVPMFHKIENFSEPPAQKLAVAYSWRFNGKKSYLSLITRNSAQLVRNGSEQEFITEHYWGYSPQQNGSTLEYRVEHSRWRVWAAQTAELHCDATSLYGERFSDPLKGKPSSAFLAEGSEVTVFKGICLKQ